MMNRDIIGLTGEAFFQIRRDSGTMKLLRRRFGPRRSPVPARGSLTRRTSYMTSMVHFEQDAHPMRRLRYSAVDGTSPGAGDEGALPCCSSDPMDRCGLCMGSEAVAVNLSVLSLFSYLHQTHMLHGTYLLLGKATTQITRVCGSAVSLRGWND
ncbi:hypothetical protein LY76DRAFT_383633 [Colletotrichum caudatum]|nr:hypothetical protein LY76DRAFT_383633 [Colletotrichum caudatum]